MKTSNFRLFLQNQSKQVQIPQPSIYTIHMSAVTYTYTFHRPIPGNSKIHHSSSHFATFQKNLNFQSETKLNFMITIQNIFTNHNCGRQT